MCAFVYASHFSPELLLDFLCLWGNPKCWQQDWTCHLPDHRLWLSISVRPAGSSACQSDHCHAGLFKNKPPSEKLIYDVLAEDRFQQDQCGSALIFYSRSEAHIRQQQFVEICVLLNIDYGHNLFQTDRWVDKQGREKTLFSFVS